MSSGREPDQPRNQGQKYLLHISEVGISSPVRDDLYPAYISPLIQRNSTAPAKLCERNNVCVFLRYFCLRKGYLCEGDKL